MTHVVRVRPLIRADLDALVVSVLELRDGVYEQVAEVDVDGVCDVTRPFPVRRAPARWRD